MRNITKVFSQHLSGGHDCIGAVHLKPQCNVVRATHFVCQLDGLILEYDAQVLDLDCQQEPPLQNATVIRYSLATQ